MDGKKRTTGYKNKKSHFFRRGPTAARGLGPGGPRMDDDDDESDDDDDDEDDEYEDREDL